MVIYATIALLLQLSLLGAGCRIQHLSSGDDALLDVLASLHPNQKTAKSFMDAYPTILSEPTDS